MKITKENSEEIKALKGALLDFMAGSPHIYSRLFLEEREVGREEVAEVLLARLANLDLAEAMGAAIRAKVRVNNVGEGIVVCTDLCSYSAVDQVFPIHAEQLMMLDLLDMEKGDTVLDLGAGSGVLAIGAAFRGGRVCAAELHPRAIRFADFNALLNGLDDSVCVVRSNWFEAFGGRTFHRIISNPPFESVPDGITSFYHSHGGQDGLDVIRAFLAEFGAYLEPGGTLQIVTYSNANDDLAIVELVRGVRGRKEIVVLPQVVPLLEFMDKYPLTERDRADCEGKRLHLVVLTIEPDGPDGLDVRMLPDDEAGIYGDILNPLGMEGRGPTVEVEAPRNTPLP